MALRTYVYLCLERKKQPQGKNGATLLILGLRESKMFHFLLWYFKMVLYKVSEKLKIL